jgi:ABC-type phosphate transport system permease subunit
MRRIAFLLVAVVALDGVVTSMAPASGQADGEVAPIFGVIIRSSLHTDFSSHHSRGRRLCIMPLRALLNTVVL